MKIPKTKLITSNVAEWTDGKQTIKSFRKLLDKLETQVKKQGVKTVYVDMDHYDNVYLCLYGNKRIVTK